MKLDILTKLMTLASGMALVGGQDPSEMVNGLLPDPATSQTSIDWTARLAATTKMVQPTLGNIKRYAWYAAVAICPAKQLDEWSCVACREVPAPSSSVVVFENTTSQIRGYVTVEDKAGVVIVGFRGANTTGNMLNNFNANLVPFDAVEDPEARVHGGYLEYVNSVATEIIDAVTRCFSVPEYQDFKLVVVGHSMGASLASLAAIKLKAALELPWSRVEVYTYGQLRTGNLEFAQWYNMQPVTMSRAVNYNDRMVHMFQGALVYIHHQNEVFVTGPNPNSPVKFCNTAIVEDPTCSNSIPSKSFSDIAHLHMFNTTFGAPAC